MKAIDCIYDFEIFQEQDTGESESHDWYIYDHNQNEIFRNEWFDSEKDAQDYLDAFILENGGEI
jgi:hypothetical protein